MIPHTIFGLPLHPLAVHAPVVLIPIVSLGLILIVIRPQWRAQYGALVAIGSVLAFLTALGAYFSGQNFKSDLENDGLSGPLLDKIQHHAALGVWMPWLAGAFAIATVAFVMLVRRGAAKNVVLLMAIVSVIVAVATTVQLIRTGDAGARSVFNG